MKRERTLHGVTYRWDTEDPTRLERIENGVTTYWKEGIGQVEKEDKEDEEI